MLFKFFRNRLIDPGGGASLASQQPSPVAAKHLEKEFAANLAYLLLANSTMPLDGKVWMCRYASCVEVSCAAASLDAVFAATALCSLFICHIG